ncbi:MAG: inositol monophosphatase family protein [Anaerolineae bacterium]
MNQSLDFIPLIALPVAEGAARAAGALVRRNFARPRPVLERKAHRYITETDHVSERVIATNLRAAYPRCKIVSQEGIKLPQTDEQDNITWWVDPLDGTVNFVHGVPHFCISIGCTDETGEVLVGVVYDPIMDELFAAVKGHGATMNGEPIQVSRVEKLRDSLIASTYIDPQAAAPGWTALAGRAQAAA